MSRRKPAGRTRYVVRVHDEQEGSTVPIRVTTTDERNARMIGKALYAERYNVVGKLTAEAIALGPE